MKSVSQIPLILALLLLAACGGAVEETAAPLLVPTAAPTLEPSPTAAPSATPSPTSSPVPSPTLPPPTATATMAATEPAAGSQSLRYHVVFVAPDDQLNVRAAAGAGAEIVGALPPTAIDITITGAARNAGASMWVPVTAGEVSGWVNSTFLTTQVPAETFCQSEEVEQLLQDLRQAVADGDEELLASLVHPQRGLRVRTSWWNPEVRFSGDELGSLLSSQATYDWGTEDGSGRDIAGSFAAVILPLLERDLVPASESGCNEILHGGTAGLVQLPPEYEGMNYASLFRPPGPEAVEMDWGTWVAGVEEWQGSYYLSYLVHYQWEI